MGPLPHAATIWGLIADWPPLTSVARPSLCRLIYFGLQVFISWPTHGKNLEKSPRSGRQFVCRDQNLFRRPKDEQPREKNCKTICCSVSTSGRIMTGLGQASLSRRLIKLRLKPAPNASICCRIMASRRQACCSGQGLARLFKCLDSFANAQSCIGMFISTPPLGIVFFVLLSFTKESKRVPRRGTRRGRAVRRTRAGDRARRPIIREIGEIGCFHSN